MANKNFFKTLASQVIFILSAAILAFLGTLFKSHTVGFQSDLQQRALDLLTNLGVLVLVMERALEIYVSIWFNKDRIEMDESALTAEKMVAVETKKYTVSKDSGNEKLNSALDKKQDANQILKLYKQKTMTYTLRVSFIVGIIISIAGFRVLDSLFISEQLMGFQLNLYKFTDIFLSAGILAGGSNGIHALTSAMGAFFDSSKDRMRSQTV
jgi:hypothetical protein